MNHSETLKEQFELSENYIFFSLAIWVIMKCHQRGQNCVQIKSDIHDIPNILNEKLHKEQHSY